jgi:hypothetical protein
VPNSPSSPSPAGPAGPAPAFDERLWPSPTGWIAVPALAAMLGIALWPVGTGAGLAAAIVGLVLAGVVAVRSATRVRVQDGELRAGSAHIPLTLLRAPQSLDADATRHALGPGLDARAHLCLRGWVRTAVRVELDDPADPTPYWIVSTRRPEALVAALGGGATDDDAGRTTGVRPAS